MIEKKSMLCPNCRKLISSDEPACPYCGTASPGSLWKRGVLGGFSLLRLDPVKSIIIVNAAFYLFSLLLNPAALGLSANPMTFLSPSDGSLFLLGATGTLPIATYGRWWTLVSASFLHGAPPYLLQHDGPQAARPFRPGGIRFPPIRDPLPLDRHRRLFPLLSGRSPLHHRRLRLLCGLIGAILYYGKSRGGFYGEQIYRQAMGWVVGLVLFGLFFPGINNWAHGGGLVSGILIAFLTGYRDRIKEKPLHRLLGTASILLTAAILLWAIIQAVYLLI